MKSRIKHYIFRESIDRREYETTFELEIHARIVKDSDFLKKKTFPP